jgi:hypothetical protein
MDEDPDKLDSVEPAAVLWMPSRHLQEHLLAGIIASLIGGTLAVASLLVELAQPKAGRWTLADSLSWGAMLPLGLVVRSYLALGRELDSFALAKSASYLFGTMVLLQIFELATKDVLPLGWQVAAWVLFGIGAMALVGGLFFTGSEPSKRTERPATRPSGKRSAGVLGGLGVALAVVLKLAGKGLLAKFWLFHLFARIMQNFRGDLIPLVALVLLGLAAGFLIWFAVCKIRLRDKLGNVAALAGWAEMLGLVSCVAATAWILVEASIALAQPGLNDQAQNQILEEKGRQLTLLAVGAVCFWTGITVFLFQSLRRRSESGEAWPEEDADPEMS